MKRWIVPAVTAAALLAALLAVLVWLERPPGGPLEPVWDRESCAHCRMHVSEHGFAAQLHSVDGEVFFFDDPGCLLVWEAEHPGAARAVYFHHLRQERWLAEAVAGFVEVSPTPMDWGFGAVDAGDPEALPLAEVRRRVLAGPRIPPEEDSDAR